MEHAITTIPSVVTSAAPRPRLSEDWVAETRGALTGVRTVLFAMAFVSIGLETSVMSLVGTDDGRPALAFLGGQAFNVAVTLVMAYLLFGGVLFAPPAL